MKILVAVRGLRKKEGGPTYTVPAMAAALHSEGCDVTVLVDDYDIPPIPGCKLVCRREIKIPLAEFVRGFDLVHDNGVWLPFNHALAKACRQAGVPRAVSPHGALQKWIIKRNRLKKWLAWSLYQRRDLQSAAVVFATAEIEAKDVRDLGYTGRMVLIPNGAEAPGMYTEKAKDVCGTRTALFLSRIHSKKGVKELIDGWINIRPSGWHLLVAGPDEAKMVDELQRKLTQAGLQDTVTFPGPLLGQARSDAFLNADFFVLPTYSENFGLVVIEAMLMGTPVMTTTGTPWGEFEEQGIGWICEPSEQSIEAKLRKVLGTGRPEFVEIGLKARDWALNRFDWQNIAKQQLDCYRSLVAAGRTHSI